MVEKVITYDNYKLFYHVYSSMDKYFYSFIVKKGILSQSNLSKSFVLSVDLRSVFGDEDVFISDISSKIIFFREIYKSKRDVIFKKYFAGNKEMVMFSDGESNFVFPLFDPSRIKEDLSEDIGRVKALFGISDENRIFSCSLPLNILYRIGHFSKSMSSDVVYFVDEKEFLKMSMYKNDRKSYEEIVIYRLDNFLKDSIFTFPVGVFELMYDMGSKFFDRVNLDFYFQNLNGKKIVSICLYPDVKDSLLSVQIFSCTIPESSYSWFYES